MAVSDHHLKRLTIKDNKVAVSYCNSIIMMENGHPVIDIVLPTYRMVPEENERYSEDSNRIV
jgi:hypothetical protein